MSSKVVFHGMSKQVPTKKICSCSNVISQPRCRGPKEVVTVMLGCIDCKAGTKKKNS